MNTCSHGLQTGICVDDMTPEVRADFDFTYRHAFDYAAQGGDRDMAEDYASWYTRTYFVDSLEDGPNHRTGMDSYRTSLEPAVVVPEPHAGRRIDAARRAKIRSSERRAAARLNKVSAA